jgi:Coproporphyrinogen III oxidase and related Fe-S oxidoreductases
VRLPHTYIRHIEAGESVVDGWEPIPRDLAMGETMILGLRLLQEGVSRVTFRTQFGIDPVEHYGHTIERLVTLGLLSVTSQRIRLNARAYAVANQVFVHFLP